MRKTFTLAAGEYIEELMFRKRFSLYPRFSFFILLAFVQLIACSGNSQNPPEGMVYIPGGVCVMGSENPNPQAHELPARKVSVDRFFMDKYEVTVEQYRQFLEANPDSPAPGFWAEQLQHPKRPVVYVSWHDAATYAQWVGKKLPTEAQWEYAARGGFTGVDGKPRYKFPWGNEITPDKANYDADSSRAWNWEDAKRYLRDVGSYPPNAYGLYDMAGNAWEWCADLYDYTIKESQPQKSSKPRRAMRGSSWANDPDDLRCSYRYFANPVTRNYNLGFRCAREAR
ncbi:formylglycine-generating enzyme family protein [candidate division KSB1 bacterium]|nr:formylglycine-generating enzyme family protein [candidate division KSB1 bacterium]